MITLLLFLSLACALLAMHFILPALGAIIRAILGFDLLALAAILAVIAAISALTGHARAADLDYPPAPPCASTGQQMLPPPNSLHLRQQPDAPMAYRPPGRPPGPVFYAPNNERCLPGFFWRVYPDGNGECWPWAN
jgi:hypothetical protein